MKSGLLYFLHHPTHSYQYQYQIFYHSFHYNELFVCGHAMAAGPML
jgi:hypothetical protein